MYDHILYKQVQVSRSDIRPHIKWAVSLVILHMVTSIFLQGLCGYIWVNILTLSPQRGGHKGASGVNIILLCCWCINMTHRWLQVSWWCRCVHIILSRSVYNMTYSCGHKEEGGVMRLTLDDSTTAYCPIFGIL